MLSVYTAEDNDVWPDAASRPPPEVREEIRRIAQEEITLEDVQDSGYAFAPWFTKFYLAEGRVRSRIDAAKERKVHASPPARDPAELEDLRRRLAKLERRVSSIVKTVGQVFGGNDRELAQRIDEVARRFADTERSRLKFRGLYEHGASYDAGSAVTYDGGLWVAMQDTCTAPRAAPGDWKLAVKAGRTKYVNGEGKT